MGLAAGSRANMVLAAVPLLAWAWWRAMGPRAEWRRQGVIRTAAAAAGPFVVCLLGSPSTTSSGSDRRRSSASPTSSAGSTPPSSSCSRSTGFVPGAVVLLRPAARTSGWTSRSSRSPRTIPGTLPSDYGVELVAGLLPVAPILLALVATPLILRRRASRAPGRCSSSAGSCSSRPSAMLLLPILNLQGVTERYQVDFAGADHHRRAAGLALVRGRACARPGGRAGPSWAWGSRRSRTAPSVNLAFGVDRLQRRPSHRPSRDVRAPRARVLVGAHDRGQGPRRAGAGRGWSPGIERRPPDRLPVGRRGGPEGRVPPEPGAASRIRHPAGRHRLRRPPPPPVPDAT